MAHTSVPRVVLTRPLPTDLLHHASEAGLISLDMWPDDTQPASRDWVLEHVRGADAVVLMMQDKVDRELIEAAGERLRVISTMSVGYDHVDLDLLKEKKIRLGNTPGVLDSAVAELCLTLLLCVSRRVPESSRLVREGAWKNIPWSPLSFCGPSMQGKTIGFLGFGSIAQTLALLLRSLNPARYLYLTSGPKPFDLASSAFSRLREGGFDPAAGIHISNEPDKLRLAEQCDVVIVLASLNPSTRHIVDSGFLARMKPTSILINASRGPLVDTSALVHALRSGSSPWGVGLDVIENEPDLPADHPLLGPELRDRVLVLPHIGSATNESRRAMADLAARNALGALNIRMPDNDQGEQRENIPDEGEMPAEVKL